MPDPTCGLVLMPLPVPFLNPKLTMRAIGDAKDQEGDKNEDETTLYLSLRGENAGNRVENAPTSPSHVTSIFAKVEL